jgi:hypothetical protein
VAGQGPHLQSLLTPYRLLVPNRRPPAFSTGEIQIKQAVDAKIEDWVLAWIVVAVGRWVAAFRQRA